MKNLCVGVRQLQLGVRHLPLEDLCVAEMFMKNVFTIHGQLSYIISDPDPKFLNESTLFKMHGTKIKLGKTHQ